MVSGSVLVTAVHNIMIVGAFLKKILVGSCFERYMSFSVLHIGRGNRDNLGIISHSILYSIP